jgi:hypothetical protein
VVADGRSFPFLVLFWPLFLGIMLFLLFMYVTLLRLFSRTRAWVREDVGRTWLALAPPLYLGGLFGLNLFLV